MAKHCQYLRILQLNVSTSASEKRQLTLWLSLVEDFLSSQDPAAD